MTVLIAPEPYAKLRGLMAEKGYNITKMAKTLHKSIPNLSQKLSGQREWKLAECYEILDLLEKDPSEIYAYFPDGGFEIETETAA